MYIESFSRKVLPQGGYGGYDVLIVDDDGKKHGVLALPRDHAGKSAIHRAAYAALNKVALTEQKATIDKAAEIMQQMAEDKEAEDNKDAPSLSTERNISEDPVNDVESSPIVAASLKWGELKAYAREKGITVTNKSKKKDLLKALKEKE